ncbi:hypothetical protein L1987_11727 [Smallanthus sonchifolius]|uniref:Uncharacterized protein n=1 Tax=Smallanthus sonchifolius TaxID=185202 RepID=A0ACB9JC48_9ASTR|nr:hypothetical protein L1987_11727 [Smallanthus sonchifolius]
MYVLQLFLYCNGSFDWSINPFMLLHLIRFLILLMGGLGDGSIWFGLDQVFYCTVAASNPHLIFLFCNLIIVILILVSLEPTSNSDHNKHTPTPIPPPPPQPLPAANENKSSEATTQTTLLQEITTNVLIDVDQVSYDDDCNLSVKEVHEESQDDELRRRVEEFIDKINRGWKAEKLSLALGSLTN